MSADIRAGKAFVELSLKDQLQAGLKAASVKLQAFGSLTASIGAGLAGIGTAIAAPFAGAVAQFANFGSDIDDMSKRTGASAEALSELAYAAEQSGATIQDVEGSLRKMQKTLSGAKGGSKEAREAFSDLSISISEISGLSPDAQLELIADRLAAIDDPAKKAAAAMGVFGKNGTTLLPLMADGASGMRAMRQEAVALGLSMSAADASAAEQLGDSWDRVKKSLKGTALSIGAVFAPAMTELLDTITGAISGATQWIKANRELIGTAVKTAVGIAATGAALFAAGNAIRIYGSAVGKVAGLIKATTGVIGSLSSAVVSLAKPFGQVGAAAQGMASAVAASALNVSAGVELIGIGAIEAAGGILGAFGQIGMDAGKAMVRGLQAAAVPAKQAVAFLASAAATQAAKIPGAVTAALSAVGGSAAAFGRGFTGEIGFFTSKTASLFWAMGERARQAVDAMAPKLIGSTGGMLATMQAQWSAATAKIVAIASPIMSRVSAGWQASSKAVSAVFGPIVSAARTAAGVAVTAWRAVGPRMATGISTAVRGAFSSLVKASRTAGAGIGAGIKTGMTGVIGVGKGVAGAIGGVASLAGAIGGAAGGTLGQIAGVLPAILMLGPALAAIVSPAGLVIAAIGGAVYAWTHYSEQGKAALKAVMDFMQPFLDIAKKTFGGVKDALQSGNLALAGKIAIAGLKAAVLTGLAQLTDAMGGTWGNALGQFGSQLAGGDFSGAWNTAIEGMAAIWDQFSAGVVATFSKAAKAVADVWQKTTTAIGSWMLDMAAKEGAVGAAFRGMLGVDVKSEAEKNKMLQERGKVKAAGNLQTTATDLEAEAIAADKAGTTDLAAAKREQAAALRAEAAKILGQPIVDPIAEAKANVAKEIGGTADAIRSTLDRMATDTEAKAKTSTEALAKSTPGGISAAQSAANKANADMAALVEEARKSKAAFDATKAAQDVTAAAGPNGAGDAAAKTKKDVVGTFSAVAAARLGGGASTKSEALLEKIERNTKPKTGGKFEGRQEDAGLLLH